MSNSCVTLVLKTNIYESKLIVIQHFARQALLLNIIAQTPDFMDKH